MGAPCRLGRPQRFDEAPRHLSVLAVIPELGGGPPSRPPIPKVGDSANGAPIQGLSSHFVRPARSLICHGCSVVLSFLCSFILSYGMKTSWFHSVLSLIGDIGTGVSYTVRSHACFRGTERVSAWLGTVTLQTRLTTLLLFPLRTGLLSTLTPIGTLVRLLFVSGFPRASLGFPSSDPAQARRSPGILCLIGTGVRGML